MRLKIDELTKYRNKTVHFSVELDIPAVASLLSDILDPLIELLEREIKNPTFKQKCIPEINRQAKPIKMLIRYLAKESEQRVRNLLLLFNGQHVPGELFGLPQDLDLPMFAEVKMNPILKNREVDIQAIGTTEEWIVEVKLRFVPDRVFGMLGSLLADLREQFKDKKIWLVIMSEIPQKYRERLKDLGILFSSVNDIERLEQTLRP